MSVDTTLLQATARLTEALGDLVGQIGEVREAAFRSAIVEANDIDRLTNRVRMAANDARSLAGRLRDVVGYGSDSSDGYALREVRKRTPGMTKLQIVDFTQDSFGKPAA